MFDFITLTMIIQIVVVSVILTAVYVIAEYIITTHEQREWKRHQIEIDEYEKQSKLAKMGRCRRRIEAMRY